MNDGLSEEEHAELGDLDPLYRRLQHYDVPEPDSRRLLIALKPVLPLSPRQRAVEWVRLAQMQIGLLETPFWWGSLFLMALGLVLIASNGSNAGVLLLILVSPVMAAGGTAYIFRPATRTLWELEQLSRVHPVELLYARLALILAFNIALALVLLLVAWSQGLQIVLWRLVLLWFGPMIGLTGLALYTSVRWGVLAGSAIPLVLWGALTFGGWQGITFPNGVQGLLLNVAGSNLLIVGAVVALIAGVTLLVLSGRMMMRTQPVWR